ncbi:hypothetical protein SprV_0200794700 [Sparganum proliferum]
MNDNLIKLRLPHQRAKFATFVSVYALLINKSDEAKKKFYDEPHELLSTVPKAYKLTGLGELMPRQDRPHCLGGSDGCPWTAAEHRRHRRRRRRRRRRRLLLLLLLKTRWFQLLNFLHATEPDVLGLSCRQRHDWFDDDAGIKDPLIEKADCSKPTSIAKPMQTEQHSSDFDVWLWDMQSVWALARPSKFKDTRIAVERLISSP